MKVYSPGLQYYVDKLKNNEPFSFVRYGNGEWDCILQLFHRTRSGSQKFTPDLRAALATSLKTEHTGEYYPALQSLTFLERQGLVVKLERWLAGHSINLTWHGGEVFTKASMRGKLYPLVKEMKKHKVVVVGPSWLRTLPFADVFIRVAKRNCWNQVKDLEARLKGLKNVVISFSAGPTTKVLIHKLQPIIGKHSWMIDFGSVWDPYCGVKSRNYHGRITPAVRRRNLTGKRK